MKELNERFPNIDRDLFHVSYELFIKCWTVEMYKGIHSFWTEFALYFVAH
jgi:hypothetical protein